jgi:hypothetical protein
VGNGEIRMKEFDLFKWLIIFTIGCLTIAALGTVDYSNAASFDDIKLMLDKPLMLTNFHYVLLILVTYGSGSK